MSEFWKRKMRTGFKILDVDQDGAITIKDFQALAEKLIVAQQLDLERDSKLKSTLTELWQIWFKEAISNQPVNKDEFVKAIENAFRSEHYLNMCSTVFRLYFSTIDANEDGIIQEEEYTSFFRIFDIDSSKAKVSFQSIDSNHDGMVSLDEYISAGIDWVTSEDESTHGKLFWGPLEP